MNIKRLLLFALLSLFFSASFGQRYVKVIERQSGDPLDSFVVSFYHVAGADIVLQGESITNKNGIAEIPDLLNHCNKITAKQLRQPIKFWPGVENLDNHPDNICVIKVDRALTEQWSQWTVHFQLKSNKLTIFYSKQMESWLPKITKILRENPSYEIQVQGHADTHEEHSGANAIATSRAKAIKQWLLKHGIEQDQIEVKGEGDKWPKVSCKDDTNCAKADAQNRRAILKIIPAE